MAEDEVFHVQAHERHEQAIANLEARVAGLEAMLTAHETSEMHHGHESSDDFEVEEVAEVPE